MSRGNQPKRGTSTEAIHGGETRPRAGNSITTPIFQTATFVFENTAEHLRGDKARLAYDDKLPRGPRKLAEANLLLNVPRDSGDSTLGEANAETKGFDHLMVHL